MYDVLERGHTWSALRVRANLRLYKTGLNQTTCTHTHTHTHRHDVCHAWTYMICLYSKSDCSLRKTALAHEQHSHIYFHKYDAFILDWGQLTRGTNQPWRMSRRHQSRSWQTASCTCGNHVFVCKLTCMHVFYASLWENRECRLLHKSMCGWVVCVCLCLYACLCAHPCGYANAVHV